MALEHPTCVVLLDDMRAREIAKAAGLTVWGTLRVMLEAKARGLTERIDPWVSRLGETGMWISEDIRDRGSLTLPLSSVPMVNPTGDFHQSAGSPAPHGH